jgi:N-acetylglucosamine-6-sulfatase
VYIESAAFVIDGPRRSATVWPLMASENARRPRPNTNLRRAAALALLAGAAMLLPGCGGSSARSAADGTSAKSGATANPSALQAPGPATGLPGRPGPPNIVFVLTDDLASNLVPYMPHVLAMERAGETFTNYFVTDSLCCPSRASILTGQFPHDTHVFDNSQPEGGFTAFHERHEERQTFATALHKRGYMTALMGKYLNGYGPYVNGVPPGWSEWDVAGNGYPEYGYSLNSNGHARRYGYRAKDYLTNVLARKGLGFIQRATARGKPFMLELATFAPHSPFTPAPRDARSFPGLRAPRTPAFDVVGSREPAWLSHFSPLRVAAIRRIDRQFRKRVQAVQAVDRMIGRIEAMLVAKGLAGDTYIVFSSDNGLHMGEHRLLPGKLTAFDTDIKVPLVVTGPGVPAGRTISQMTENVDLCPTFERLGGAPVPRNVDGHNLVTLLHGGAAGAWRTEILVEHHGRVLDPGDPDLPTQGSGNPPSYEAIRTASSLYVEYSTGEREYYDLTRDPFELSNVASGLPPARRRTLHRTLVGIERCHGGTACWRAQHGST